MPIAEAVAQFCAAQSMSTKRSARCCAPLKARELKAER